MSIKSWEITCPVPANIYRTVLQIDVHRKRFECRPICLDFEWTRTFSLYGPQESKILFDLGS